MFDVLNEARFTSRPRHEIPHPPGDGSLKASKIKPVSNQGRTLLTQGQPLKSEYTQNTQRGLCRWGIRFNKRGKGLYRVMLRVGAGSSLTFGIHISNMPGVASELHHQFSCTSPHCSPLGLFELKAATYISYCEMFFHFLTYLQKHVKNEFFLTLCGGFVI